MPAQDPVADVPSQKPSNKPIILISILVVAIVALIAVYFLVLKPKSPTQKASSPNQYSQTTTQTTPRSPTPTPLPQTGPGPWACDPNGDCNRYNDTVTTSGCPKTFADSYCLNQCADKAVRCEKF